MHMYIHVKVSGPSAAAVASCAAAAVYCACMHAKPNKRVRLCFAAAAAACPVVQHHARMVHEWLCGGRDALWRLDRYPHMYLMSDNRTPTVTGVAVLST